MTHDQDVDALYEKYPVPKAWRVAQWTLSFALVGVAFVLASVLEQLLWALVPFVLSSPAVTIRFVSWVALALFGKPVSWPDTGPSQ